MRRAWGVAIAAAAAALPGPPAAHAALAFRDCPDAEGFECATLDVPRDRSDAMGGTIRLRVAREADPAVFARIPLLALSGGPGQPGVVFGPLWRVALDGVQSRYRIVLVDPRGTGRSGLLRCPELQRQALTDVTVRAPGTVESCAARLGPARDLYSTTETVEDLEAVRDALGAPRIALVGISYGTYYALRYARAHPERVDRLILDSVVTQENVGLDLPATWPALRGLLTSLCDGGRCRRITPDPLADLAATLERLRREPLAAPVYDRRGASHVVRVATPAALYDLLLASALDENLRLALPALLAAAADGDVAPLVRAKAASTVDAPVRAQELDWAVHAATLCADFGPAAAYGLLAPDVTAPFTPEEAAANGMHDMCARWPASAAPPPPPPGPLPDVPTLFLTGEYDVLTPPADAALEAARSPQAQLVVVPGVGHSTLTGTSACVGLTVVRFVRGRPAAAPCQRRDLRPLIGLAAAFPRVLADVRPAAGLAGRGGVAVAIALRTIEDATGGASGVGRFPALRGGTVSLSVVGTSVRWIARGARLLPGVRVDGTLALDDPAGTRVTVRGQGLRASFVVDRRTGRVRGTVDGKPFSGRLASISI